MAPDAPVPSESRLWPQLRSARIPPSARILAVGADSLPRALPPGCVQLREVVRRADERPLPARLVETAQQKRTQASPFLDVAKHWLDDGLALLVDGGALPGGQLPSHPLLRRHVRGRPSPDLRRMLAVLGPAGRDVRIDAQLLDRSNVLFGEVAGVCTRLRRRLAAALDHTLDHRHQVLDVRRLI